MLSHKELLEQLEVQRQDLIGMVLDDVVAGKAKLASEKPPVSRAIAFSESFILCLSKSEAELCVGKDREGARAFVEVANEVLKRIKNGELKLASRRNTAQTEFYLLVSLVREYMKL